MAGAVQAPRVNSFSLATRGIPAHAYVTEDIDKYVKSVDLAGLGTYHVVVGNPPYISAKDKRESENYRAAFPICSGSNALTVPFAERFFRLATAGETGGAEPGT